MNPFHLIYRIIILVFIEICGGISLHAQEAKNASFHNTIEIKKGDSESVIIDKATHVVPTHSQLEALQDGFIGFIHFGPNTFTKREWGTGKEDPGIFNPVSVDTDQWCRAMKDAGMKKVIFTAKHHDGYVLWQSRYTKHGIMSSPYQGGRGDILKELSKSCKKYGLKLGVYLSPADLYQLENPKGYYGNSSAYSTRIIPRPVMNRPFQNKTTFTFKVDDYNEYFLNQLFELLTEYGPISEVWFDGANPKKKGNQKYAYQDWKKLIHTLAPSAVIFGKEDLRWVGNEAGDTRETEWNVIPFQKNPDSINMFSDLTENDLGSRTKLYNAHFLHYYPAEVDTSIRDGWFYRDETSQSVKSAEEVFNIYESAVGGNAIFLLNVPPNREGRFAKKDLKVLKKVGQFIEDTYRDNLLSGSEEHERLLDDDLETFELLSQNDSTIEFSLKQPIMFNRFVIQEAVSSYGERVEKHLVQGWINGRWQDLGEGTNIGYKRILRFSPVELKKIRIKFLKVRNRPVIATVGAFYYHQPMPQLSITRDSDGLVHISINDSMANRALGFKKIIFGINGEEPLRIYDGPFFLKQGSVEAFIRNEDEESPGSGVYFGLFKKNWKVLSSSHSRKNHLVLNAIDANSDSYWISDETNKEHYIALDLAKEYKVGGFIYAPKKIMGEGLMEKGTIQSSRDGVHWDEIGSFHFGNIYNDPSKRIYRFRKPVMSRYFRIKAEKIAGDKKTVTASEIGFSVAN
ncbi:alpha-1,3/4-fucosidase [Christiangramia fulva]|uniref:alpha-L-fucosidase n=1 Tax=Christiangramia fulva TaxID=2126553 RepID=A0A2R3ZA47_9FLAO|nr:alpha-L-fucosidase [Christiangramia fulva]AVR47136.1 alpha-1,3/4-fucosidase [Christiangramia fulva]